MPLKLVESNFIPLEIYVSVLKLIIICINLFNNIENNIFVIINKIIFFFIYEFFFFYIITILYHRTHINMLEIVLIIGTSRFIKILNLKCLNPQQIHYKKFPKIIIFNV